MNWTTEKEESRRSSKHPESGVDIKIGNAARQAGWR